MKIYVIFTYIFLNSNGHWQSMKSEWEHPSMESCEKAVEVAKLLSRPESKLKAYCIVKSAD